METIIHLIIIWLTQNTARRSGSVTKAVRCENCTLSYEYEMRRTVKLRGEATKEALAREADQRLQKQLAEECEPVPCPYCGWYQQHMVEQTRRKALERVPRWFILFVFLTTVLVGISTLQLHGGARQFAAVDHPLVMALDLSVLSGLLLCVLLLVYRLCVRFAYSPNRRRWTNKDAPQ